MGVVQSVLNEGFPPKSRFEPERDIPDLTGQVIIVTGGYNGIGLHTVRALLNKNAKVYIAGRSKEKGDQALETLKNERGRNQARFLKLDLASLGSVQNAASEFMRQETQLHVLFNNAGVMIPPIKEVTADGYDLQFGTNVLGHFYFTKLLLPVLLATAKSSPTGKVRVINLSSIAQRFGGLQFATLKDSPERKKMTTAKLYIQSKFGIAVFSRQLAKRYGDQGIVSIALNPGNLKTELSRHSSPFEIFVVPFFHAPRLGALTQLWAGTAEETLQYNGEFLIPWARKGKVQEKATDERVGDHLWDWLEEQVKDIPRAKT
ncbi:hypothetical protein BDV98DRAFT_542593 [Pterulicium gracile]|uniref:NAD(P)-binding protein n=1 Tax=Pterulicium gracile TaxID=1884261 RepID=A0A5C3QUC8_9AGAR|nr:hypothetical protein BDV98DRAFT_542593 [Pterula gracilis]